MSEFVTAAELAAVAKLRKDLLAADFCADKITVYLGGTEYQNAVLAGNLRPALGVINEQPVSVLRQQILFFVLGQRLDKQQLNYAFPNLGVQGLQTLQLISETADELFAPAASLNCAVVPDAAFDTPAEWFVLSDLDDHLRQDVVQSDYVMGVGGATKSLLQQAPADQIELAVDLGTGSGVVAFHLAKRAQRVIATDIATRALRFASLNAALNEISNIEFRQGNLFEPVLDVAADLLLSNPPFVIEPLNDDKYEYRNAGKVGDELAAEIVAGAPNILKPGGEALFLTNWENKWGSEFSTKPEDWLQVLASTGKLAGAWVVERENLSPLNYALMWLRDGGEQRTFQKQEKLAAALDDFKSRQVASISMGTIRLRRGQNINAPAVRISKEHGAIFQADPSGAAGKQLAATFTAGLQFASLTDTELLALKLELQDTVLEQRIHKPGFADPQQLVLLNSAPYMQQQLADTLLVAALGACDGELTLSQICAALAQIFESDYESVAAELLPQLRSLVWQGFFKPLHIELDVARV